MVKRVICIGMECPKPIIELKRAMISCEVGASIYVEVDNEVAVQNVTRFLADYGVKVTFAQVESAYAAIFSNPEIEGESSDMLPDIEVGEHMDDRGVDGLALKSANHNSVITSNLDFAITAIKHRDILPQTPVNLKSAHPRVDTVAPSSRSRGGTVLLLTSDSLGASDNGVGVPLMKAFLSTLESWDDLPSHIILMDRGVLLASNESSSSLTLYDLQNNGVKVFLCGTCVTYYGLQDRFKAGEIRDMYSISNCISIATRVIVL